MTVKTVSIESIRADIETLRAAKTVGNEAANLASYSLELEGDDAILANRIASRGSDPLSLLLVLKAFGFEITKEQEEAVRAAHFQGPGGLEDQLKHFWLVLASQSLDENAQASASVTDKVRQFAEAIQWLLTASEARKNEAAWDEEDAIKELPFRIAEGCHLKVPTRIYESDRGFAAAYWSGIEHAAVKEGDLLFVGSNNRPLAEIGISVDKELNPQFGIIFP